MMYFKVQRYLGAVKAQTIIQALSVHFLETEYQEPINNGKLANIIHQKGKENALEHFRCVWACLQQD